MDGACGIVGGSGMDETAVMEDDKEEEDEDMDANIVVGFV